LVLTAWRGYEAERRAVYGALPKFFDSERLRREMYRLADKLESDKR
jgi:hypothetical protein